MQSVASTYGWGLADIDISQLEGVDTQTKLSVMVGNSKASKLGRQYLSAYITQAITTTLKRRYYRAGLRVDRFTADSFTLAFKTDARALADAPYSFSKTIEFITKYGAYVYEGATLGAALWRRLVVIFCDCRIWVCDVTIVVFFFSSMYLLNPTLNAHTSPYTTQTNNNKSYFFPSATTSSDFENLRSSADFQDVNVLIKRQNDKVSKNYISSEQ